MMLKSIRYRPLNGRYAYVYVDGVYLKRSWGGEVQNVSVLVVIGVNEGGYREILGAAEGMKEDYESWLNFFKWLKKRGLNGVRLFIGDKNLGMLETIGKVFPDAKYQRCIVHFYRNVFSVVPRGRIRTNNTLERLNREIKRRTRAIGAFPDGNSALMLVCARLRHVAGSDWGIERYMNMDHLLEMDMDLSAD